MTFRSQAVAALAVLGLVAELATAQPTPPARPTYSSYSSIIRPGGGGSSYGFGFNQQDNAAVIQNQLLAQQLGQTAQQLNGIQTFLQTGVNPAMGITGRGAVYNSLGHWYPSARNGGGGGGMSSGGLASPNRPVVGGGLMRNSGAMPGGLGGFGSPTGGAGAATYPWTPPTTGTGTAAGGAGNATGGAKGSVPIPPSK